MFELTYGVLASFVSLHFVIWVYSTQGEVTDYSQRAHVTPPGAAVISWYKPFGTEKE